MRSKLILFLALVPAALPAASFSLGAVLRVGGPAEPELYLGPSAAAPATTAGVFPGWIDGVNHNFTLSYNAATNTALVSGNWLGIFTSSTSWVVTGGSPSSTPRDWVINAGGIRLTAENNTATASSISIQNLSISGAGFSTINPASMTVSQNGTGTQSVASAAPITFTTPNGGGSWVLSGQVRFVGPFASSTVAGDQLRAAFDVFGSDVAPVPEPATLLISALGFAALGVWHHLRHRRRVRTARSVSIQPQVKTGLTTS